MFAKVRIDPHSGVFAHAALKNKVQFGNVLTISDAAGTGPPSATLDTTHAPFLAHGAGRATRPIGHDRCGGRQRWNRVRSGAADRWGGLRMHCAVHSISDFQAWGTAKFGLKADIGPIILTPGGPDLGTIAPRYGLRRLDCDVRAWRHVPR